MPITDEQRERRKTRLGSTDIAAILGVDHFRTAYDVYLEKTDKLEEIEAGLVSFEDQFLAYMALPNGSTVGEFMQLPENAERLAETKMPKLLTS